MNPLLLSLLKRYTLTAVMICLLTSPLTAFSYEKINIAVGEWPPYISKNQKFNGVVAHIITDIFHDIGLQANLQFLPWSRAYSDTSKGMYSASAIWMHKDNRKEYFIYSDEVLTEEFVFFHKKSLSFNWNSIADLKQFNIGNIYGYSYGPELDEAIETKLVKTTQVTSPEQNFKMLLHERIDIFPFELNVGNAILKEHFSAADKQEITYHPTPFLKNSSYVMFPKALETSKQLVNRFNVRLNEMKKSGEYAEYFKNLEAGFYDIDD